MQAVAMKEDGQIVVPAAVPEAMGLNGGERVTLSLDEGLQVQTQRQKIAQAQTLMRKYVRAEVSFSDELIAERRVEATAGGVGRKRLCWTRRRGTGRAWRWL